MARDNDDPREGEYSFQHEPDTGVSLCVTIIEAVAWVKNEDPLELTPLGRVLDAEALEQLLTAQMRVSPVNQRVDEPSDARLRVTFEYEDCVVTVGESGEFTVECTSA